MKPSDRIKQIMRNKHLKGNEDYILNEFELALLTYLDEQSRTKAEDVNKLLEQINK